MKKTVLKVSVLDAKDKRKVMKLVSTLSGIESIAIDLKEQKLTVTGTVDPVTLVLRLRKKEWQVEILTVGPAKEDKKEADKKRKGENKKIDAQTSQQVPKAYQGYNPYNVARYNTAWPGDDSYCMIM